MISKFHVAVDACAEHCRQSEAPEAALGELADRLRREGWDSDDAERLVAAISALALD